MDAVEQDRNPSSFPLQGRRVEWFGAEWPVSGSTVFVRPPDDTGPLPLIPSSTLRRNRS